MALYICRTCGGSVSAGKENEHNCMSTQPFLVFSEKEIQKHPLYKTIKYEPGVK